jgi:hypothetical protein
MSLAIKTVYWYVFKTPDTLYDETEKALPKNDTENMWYF